MSGTISLIDSHAHIYYRDFTGDFDDMLKRAEDAPKNYAAQPESD